MHRRAGDAVAIRDPAIVFTPNRLLRLAEKVDATDVAMVAGRL